MSPKGFCLVGLGQEREGHTGERLRRKTVVTVMLRAPCLAEGHPCREAGTQSPCPCPCHCHCHCHCHHPHVLRHCRGGWHCGAAQDGAGAAAVGAAAFPRMCALPGHRTPHSLGLLKGQGHQQDCEAVGAGDPMAFAPRPDPALLGPLWGPAQVGLIGRRH